MSYAQFERLVIGLGVAAIGGNALVIVTSNGWSNWTDLAASLLLLPVLVIAVHSGRRPGLIASLAASAILVVLKIPVLSIPSGVSVRELAIIAVSLVAFGSVGIVGGEICSRIKYGVARLEDSASIDDWSHVYNQRHASELIRKARERHSRYGEPFTVVVISDASTELSGLRPARRRALVRAAASYLRGDVRMIDEIARLDDGRFLIVLPHTGLEGGHVVSDRLIQGVRDTLGASDTAVVARCIFADDDLELTSLLASIDRRDNNQLDGSGTYTSSAASTVNPSATSAASAEGSSTFRTSTAASPEGSTKQ